MRFISSFILVILLTIPVQANVFTDFFSTLFGSETEQPSGLFISESDTPQPIITKYTGTEADVFTVGVDNLGNGNYRYCYYPKEEMSQNDPRVTALRIYTKDNEQAGVIERTGDTEKETERGNLVKLCYTTDADYVQAGDNTIIIEDQTTKTVVFQPTDSFNITSTLYRDVYHENNYSNTVNDVFVFVEENKYGANWSSDNTSYEKFRYDISASIPTYEKNGKRYFKDGVNGYYLNLDDICTVENANCTIIGYTQQSPILVEVINETTNQSYTETQYTTTTWGYTVDFYEKTGFIDPQYSLELLETNISFANVSFNGNGNFTHLSINTSDTERYLVGDTDADAYIEVSSFDTTKLDDNFTISFWADIPTGTNSKGLIAAKPLSGAGTYIVYISGKVRFMQNNGTDNDILLTDGDIVGQGWTHVVATQNVTDMCVYLDGSLDKCITKAYPNSVSTGLRFGQAFTDSANYGMSGAMDEIMIFEGVISDQEITNIYNLNRTDYNGSTTTVVGYWDFDDSFEDFADKIGDNDGTNSGGMTTFSYDRYTDTQFDSSEWNTPYNDLIAYYSFDIDTNSTVYDLSGNGNIGTTGDGFTKTEGIFGKTGVFNNSYVEIGEFEQLDLIGTDNFAVMAWVKSDSTSSSTLRVFDGYNGASPNNGLLAAFQPSTNTLRFWTDHPETTTKLEITTVDVADGQWHHVAWVRNSSTDLAIYVDGQVEGHRADAVAGDIGVTSSTYPFRIGDSKIFNQGWEGEIDEAMIFHGTLQAEDISAIYNNQSGRFPTYGIQTHPYIKPNETTNFVNLTIANYQTAVGTNISGRVGYWSVDNGYDTSDEGLVGYWTGDYHEQKVVADFQTADSDYLEVSTDNDTLMHGFMDDDWAFAIWCRDEGANDIAWSKGTSGSNEFYCYGNSNRFRYRSGGDKTSVSQPGTSEWHHAVYSFDGTNYYIYFDGVLDNTVAGSATGVEDSYPLQIGVRDTTGYREGQLADLMFFNDNISASDVIEVYQKTLRQQTYTHTNLSHWYPLNGSGIDIVSGMNATAYGSVEYINDTIRILDVTGNNNDAQLMENANSTDEGIFNNSFSFDGSGDYVSIADSPSLDGFDEVSVAAWIFKTPESSASADTIVSKYSTAALTLRNYLLRYDSQNNEIDWFAGNASTAFDSVAVSIEDGRWHHIVCKHDTSGGSCYLDGVKTALSFPYNGGIGANSQALYIGNSPHSGTDYFTGSIDEAMIYNRSLSADEIKDLYIKGKANYQYTDWDMVDANGLAQAIIPTTKAHVFLPQFKLNGSGFYTPYILDLNPISTTFADLTPPQVQFVSPTLNSTIKTFLEINVTGTDETNLTSLNISIYNSTGFVRTNSSNASPFYWNVQLPTEEYWYNATAYDNGGNSNSTETYNISIDVTAPTLSFIDFTTSSGIQPEGQTNISANLSGSDSHIDTVVVQLWNTTQFINSSNGTTPHTVDFTNLPFGDYILGGFGNDTVGNIGYVANRSITLSPDTTNPVLSNPSVNTSLVSGEQAYFNVTIEDSSILVSKQVHINDTTNTVTSYDLILDSGNVYFNDTFQVTVTGTYWFKMNATDEFDNTGSTGWQSFEVKQENLNITNLQETHSLNWWTASWDNPTTSLYINTSVLVYESNILINTSNQSQDVFTYLTAFNNTNYTVSLQAHDIYGQNGPWNNISFMTDVVNVSSSQGASQVCRYKKLGYYDETVPFMKEANCV